jgi:hypothetical protein
MGKEKREKTCKICSSQFLETDTGRTPPRQRSSDRNTGSDIKRSGAEIAPFSFGY